MSRSQILIVGAGPTGLVLALCLAHHGIKLRIIDKNSGPGQASRAMAVQARTLEFYRQLGFADEVVALGIKMERLHLRESGQDIASLSFQDMGGGLSPYPFMLCFPQDDHERFLVEKLQAAGVEVEWGVALQHFSQDEAGVRAVLDKGGSVETCETGWLCGCDGAHSRVRHGLEIAFPGGTYDQMFYVADVGIAGHGGHDMFANLSRNGFLLMLPVRSRGMQRLIGIVPQQLAGHASLTFEDIRPGAEAILGMHVTQVNWFSTYFVHHRVAGQFQRGRCFLAGDAAHVHSPAGGQGMNTGIGDAVNLAWKLAHVAQGRADAAILDSYGQERIAFARKLVATTDKIFQAMVGKGLGSRLLRTWLLPHLMPMLTRLASMRRSLFMMVSQLRISYRGSALGSGSAGLHGGDRLPWVPSPDDGNFGALVAMDWQLHVYGRATPDLTAAADAMDLPLKIFAFSASAGQAGLKRDAAYLVRPDGYIALAMADQNSGELRQWALKLGLKFGRGQIAARLAD